MSIMDSEYMGLPYLLREVIPIMQLLKDIRKTDFL